MSNDEFNFAIENDIIQQANAVEADEALSDAQVINASEVLAYLENNPHFFKEHAEVLANVQLASTTGGNVISMAHWQTNVLREKADQHKARLEKLLAQATNNQRSYDKLLALVIRWLEQTDASALPAQVEADVRRAFALDAIRIMVWSDDAKSLFYPVGNEWSDNVVIFANSLRAPYCGPCKGFEIEAQLAKQTVSGHIASLSIVPLWGKRMNEHVCVGVLLMGAEDVHRFTPDMATHFLQSIGEMAGAALSRVRSPVHLSIK
ncbi:hypothetical protein DTO96_101998 [Ephemeroptericola cinctiostellae]|uniref:GAF domain-containing protein n=1 Tax=Ephemeroptericola cinctiostellae TaxID=2268024 RepID=A0A345DD14_9BURK|nr:DUF484 family protein [Ephemeroptericola cinctiostellae]AXF86252.1 hypothetical protein DTO96_101998 [Ephemeroptericola cinctiostellae]